MNVETLTQEINILIEQEQFLLAENVILQHPHHCNDIAFNDAYATALYFLNKYPEAIKILDFNIELILKTNPFSHWLLTSYFQKANCYLAMNNKEKAAYFYTKCLVNDFCDTELKKEISSILQVFQNNC